MHKKYEAIDLFDKIHPVFYALADDRQLSPSDVTACMIFRNEIYSDLSRRKRYEEDQLIKCFSLPDGTLLRENLNWLKKLELIGWLNNSDGSFAIDARFVDFNVFGLPSRLSEKYSNISKYSVGVPAIIFEMLKWGDLSGANAYRYSRLLRNCFDTKKIYNKFYEPSELGRILHARSDVELKQILEDLRDIGLIEYLWSKKVSVACSLNRKTRGKWVPN